MEFLGIDHVDLRVPSLALVEPFYEALLPRLGLTRKGYANVAYAGAKWDDGTAENHNAVEFYEEVRGRPARFMGIIEEEDAQPARGRLAFAVAPGTLVEWEGILREIGAHDIEPNHEPEYPAIFFADPGGTRLEVCARPPRP
jgi:hypothetical protein